MEVSIDVKQEIKNGVVQPKTYTLHVKIGYGTEDFRWYKNMFLGDVDAETLLELIPLLTKRLEEALKL